MTSRRRAGLRVFVRSDLPALETQGKAPDLKRPLEAQLAEVRQLLAPAG